jgi:hypothetical protein
VLFSPILNVSQQKIQERERERERDQYMIKIENMKLVNVNGQHNRP